MLLQFKFRPGNTQYPMTAYGEHMPFTNPCKLAERVSNLVNSMCPLTNKSHMYNFLLENSFDQVTTIITEVYSKKCNMIRG